MTTVVRVNTYTQSVTHLTDSIVAVIQAIITELGLSPRYLHDNWDSLEAGLTTWLSERTLKSATLEVFQPGNVLVARVDLQISYGSFLDNERQFYSDLASAKLAARKLGTVASSCRYRIVVSWGGWHTPVAGWSSTTLLSTDGLRRRAVGDLIGSPGIRSDLAIWIR
jgi:hypothetical protein